LVPGILVKQILVFIGRAVVLTESEWKQDHVEVIKEKNQENRN
jgi:hypothetical protein